MAASDTLDIEFTNISATVGAALAAKADRVALKADRVALESLRRNLVPAALPLVTGVERPPVTCLAAGWQAATGTTYSPCHRRSCTS